jgi:hypothetical protein
MENHLFVKQSCKLYCKCCLLCQDEAFYKIWLHYNDMIHGIGHHLGDFASESALCASMMSQFASRACSINGTDFLTKQQHATPAQIDGLSACSSTCHISHLISFHLLLLLLHSGWQTLQTN